MTHKYFQDRSIILSTRFLYKGGEKIGEAPVEGGSSEEMEKAEVRAEAVDEKKELRNSIELKNDTREIYKEYQTLKEDPELKKLLRDSEVFGAKLSEEKKEKIYDKHKAIAKQIHLMSINLSKEAAKKLPNGFKKEDMINQVFKLVEDWNLDEAEGDLGTFFDRQEALYQVMKEKLGADFEKLSPVDQIRKAMEVADIKDLPKEAKGYLNALGSDMPVGLSFSDVPVQRGIESIMKGSSLNKGSFFMKAGGAVAGILTVTSIMANILGPAVGMAFSVAKNVFHPKKAFKEIKEQLSGAWGNKRTTVKRILGTGVFAGFALHSLNPKAFKKVTGGITGAGKDIIDSGIETGGNIREKITHTTPSHEIIKKLKKDKNKETKSFLDDKNVNILMNFYKKSEDGFDLDTLSGIRNISHLNKLKKIELDTGETLTRDAEIAYKRGRQRLEIATKFLETVDNSLNELDVTKIHGKFNYGKLAELMLDKYNYPTGKKSFLFKAGGVASDVAGGIGSFGVGAAKYFDYFNIIGGRDKYEYSSDVREGEEIPPEILEVMKGVIPEPEELKKIGLEPKKVLKKDKKTLGIFGLLINQVRRLQHPRSFIKSAQ